MAAGIYKKFVELLPYPLHLIENPTRTQDVMGPYRELLSEGAREGFTPVILTLTEALLEAMRMNLADWAGLLPRTDRRPHPYRLHTAAG